MKYIFDGLEFDSVEKTDLEFIKKILKQSVSSWSEGTGDAAINLIEKKDCLIFFKLKEGIYIEHLPSATAPLIQKDKKASIITHHVGGEPTDVPDVCLCDEAVAFKIISNFILTNGQLSKDYSWVDIFDYIEDRYE